MELALVKLHRVTGKPLYLEMARKFLEIRGVTYVPRGEGVMAPTYAQQHAPVLEQKQAVGHAVRATYLYSGMADVGTLTGRFAEPVGGTIGFVDGRGMTLRPEDVLEDSASGRLELCLTTAAAGPIEQNITEYLEVRPEEVDRFDRVLPHRIANPLRGELLRHRGRRQSSGHERGETGSHGCTDHGALLARGSVNVWG